MKIKIKRTTGEKTYDIIPLVEVAFEKEFKGGFYHIWQNESRLEHLYWLAWKTEAAHGEPVGSFGDEYLKGLPVNPIEIVGDDPNG